MSMSARAGGALLLLGIARYSSTNTISPEGLGPIKERLDARRSSIEQVLMVARGRFFGLFCFYIILSLLSRSPMGQLLYNCNHKSSRLVSNDIFNPACAKAGWCIQCAKHHISGPGILTGMRSPVASSPSVLVQSL
jgi:hypothetical protein